MALAQPHPLQNTLLASHRFLSRKMFLAPLALPVPYAGSPTSGFTCFCDPSSFLCACLYHGCLPERAVSHALPSPRPSCVQLSPATLAHCPAILQWSPADVSSSNFFSCFSMIFFFKYQWVIHESQIFFRTFFIDARVFISYSRGLGTRTELKIVKGCKLGTGHQDFLMGTQSLCTVIECS